VLVLSGVALSGVGGIERQVAGATPGETPAHRITRLRAKATRVQAAIDRMHARVESLVEDYNEVHEALARTRAEQTRTRRQVVEARRQLRAARKVLGRRLWTIYTGGAPSTLGQLLGADSVHDALVTTKYQEQVVGADRAALDRVERLRREVEALAARLADQAERQERLRARLVAKRRQIESRLAAQRRYLKRLGRELRRAVVQERRRRSGCGARPSCAGWPPSGRPGRGPPPATACRGPHRAGPAPPPGPPPGRSRSPGPSWAGRTCGGRPGRARTTARA